MLITISCGVIGHIRNNVNDLIGAKTTKGKECCSNVRSRVWGGALRDETKNGCDSLQGRRGRPFYDGEDGDHRVGYMYYVVLARGDFGPVLSAVGLLRVEEISKGMKILVF